MKKIIAIVLSLVLALGIFAGCQNTSDAKTISVAASPTPHAQILQIAKAELEKEGYTLKIVEYNDYVQPNNVVDSGEVDANYFQHVPYLDDFNANNGTKVVSVAAIHVEPMGIYGGKQTSLDAIKG